MARTETFEAIRPDGSVVVVTRNIDTGEQAIVERDATEPVSTDGADEAGNPVSADVDADPVKRKPGRPKKSD